MRYLTETDTTWIVEWLHQSHGYSEMEMQSFFDFLASSATPSAVREQGQQAGYLRPNPMRNYFYLRATQKEPLDWLYTSAGLTLIANLDDNSILLIPEFSYTGIENIELRTRFSLWHGNSDSEYEEKISTAKWEVRARYFF